MLEESQPVGPSPGSCAWAYRVNISSANGSISELRIVNLKHPGNSSRERNGGRYLRNCQQIFPEQRPSDNPLRNDNHIARIEACGENVRAIPFAGSSSNHRAVCPNDED